MNIGLLLPLCFKDEFLPMRVFKRTNQSNHKLNSLPFQWETKKRCDANDGHVTFNLPQASVRLVAPITFQRNNYRFCIRNNYVTWDNDYDDKKPPTFEFLRVTKKRFLVKTSVSMPLKRNRISSFIFRGWFAMINLFLHSLLRSRSIGIYGEHAKCN